jgi:ATP phosphoribosyltransferase
VADLYDQPWVSVETVMSELEARELIPQLIKKGAVGIIEYPLNKVI